MLAAAASGRRDDLSASGAAGRVLPDSGRAIEGDIA
jgi:hypothetical protein